MVAQGSQFSLKDVEVVVAQVDLDAVGNFMFFVFSKLACIYSTLMIGFLLYKVCYSYLFFLLWQSIPVELLYVEGFLKR